MWATTAFMGGGDRLVGDHLALAQRDDAVAHREHVGQAVADQDDGDALALQLADRSSTCSTSRTASAAVGSSMITSFGSKVSARAIATDCCWPPESWPTR